MACRDVDKAQTAKLEIEDQCKDMKGVGFMLVAKCDLSSLESIRRCAQHVLDTERQLNILVNNAGVMMCPKSETADGFEMQFGTNHLGHFLLTLLLLPRIRNSTPARIVTVASIAHLISSEIHFGDLNYKRRTYHSIEAYAQSKLANVVFSKELARKLKWEVTLLAAPEGSILVQGLGTIETNVSPMVTWRVRGAGGERSGRQVRTRISMLRRFSRSVVVYRRPHLYVGTQNSAPAAVCNYLESVAALHHSWTSATSGLRGLFLITCRQNFFVCEAPSGARPSAVADIADA
ncbi:Retinol dehydrogenase 12 [Eumeta japonica]|uniref:Retinol dehydrogenase 12 n=1 Tax=Eumeta variegata TaxID=151549 RepID=A0A4C1ZZJ6_EUMVA|nr:Retinol dehydrogenase 12 [Eumeta japonica]